MRLIDADYVLQLLRAEYNNTEQLIKQGETHLNNLAEGYTEAAHIMNNVPAVEGTPIVCCKDCVYSCDEVSYLYCSYGVCFEREVPPNFFCAEGKRHEE